MSGRTARTVKVATILGECLVFPQLPCGCTELTGGAQRSLTWRIASFVGCSGQSLRDSWEWAPQLLSQRGRP